MRSERAVDASSFVLRLGLAIVLLDFGLDKMSNPGLWLMYVPTAMSGLAGDMTSLTRAVQAQGLLELVVGAHLGIGFLTRQFAACSTILLFAVILAIGWTPVGIRDAGLLSVACAIVVLGPGRFSLDCILTQKLASRRLPALGWSTAVCLGLLVFFLRPGSSSASLIGMNPVDISGPFRPIPTSVDVDESKVSLGQMLFHDKRLSGQGTVSCASCHKAEFFGADGRAVSMGTNGALTRRNSPTIFNAAFNFRQFWDGRARSLEDQIDEPLLNRHEMAAASWDQVLRRISADSRYQKMFSRIYTDGVTSKNLKNAIAEFERSLITPNAPFDRFLRGDSKALSEPAQRGYTTFTGLGCVSCHHGINVGGNSFQAMGKMSNHLETQGNPDADLGRFLLTGDPRDRFVFRVPSLRNIAETGPYFHDGSVATLENAVRVMARHQLGYELSDGQVRDLVAFLESLTGESPGM